MGQWILVIILAINIMRLSHKTDFTPNPPKGGFLCHWFSISSPLRLRVAITAFGRRSRPTADEDGGARLGDLGVALRKRLLIQPQ